MSHEPFAQMLTGGHPNSLGRTLEVVEAVLEAPQKLEELYACYFEEDPVVRLRTSNALKRICREHPDWLVPFIDRLLTQIADLDQASAQWTLATLFGELAPLMSPEQLSLAKGVLERNLSRHTDWIVLNTTMQTLADWARGDAALRKWLRPQLERLQNDTRKSVARTAGKVLERL